MNLIEEVCKSFNAHAHEYEQAAVVQNEIGRRMFERLDYLKINPQRILDLGCGNGLFSRQLRARYPKALVVGFDLSAEMLRAAKSKQGFRSRWSLVNGDMMNLPFASGAFDLIFSNQVIHWGNPVKEVFRELNRVMNVNACLMFTTLGPDTFKELRQAWSSADNHAHSNDFSDMHDLGDWLMEERFVEPIVDMEVLTVQYESLENLLRSLKAQGVRNIHPNRQKGLTGKQAWRRFEAYYSEHFCQNSRYPLSYEVVYGHAWKGQQRIGSQGAETLIPISSIQRRSR